VIQKIGVREDITLVGWVE